MTLLSRLEGVVGARQVLVDPDVIASYGRDWTGRWQCSPRVVVRPGNTREVSETLALCADSRTPVVTQGGNTGLVGGSVPTRDGSLVLSTERLIRLDPVDTVTGQVTVGAGVRVAHLQKHAAAVGFAYGVDLASRDSATIGGTIATNAGGVRVVRHGDTRAQVLGVEAVFADGSVMSDLRGLAKDSAGFDIGGLLVGSEGSLAVITAARLRLQPPLPDDRHTALVGVETMDAALSLLRQGEVLAAELIVGAALSLVCRATGLPDPLERQWPFVVLLETAGAPDLPEGADAVVDRRAWAYRERLTEAVSTLGVVHKLDVSLPLTALSNFLSGLSALTDPYDVYVFGHLAEGNLHIEVVGADADDDAVDARVLRAVADLGGSISAEHGVGRAKSAFLPWTRDAAQRAAMGRVKHALDPHGLLNPGVLFT